MKNISIALQRNTPTRSGSGQPVASWATYATVFGKVKTLRGGSYYAAQETANETAIELFIYNRTDILPGDRAIMGGVTYEMAGPPENLAFRNREMLIRLRHVQ